MTKTVRGTYFYICVGPNYYAGTRPIMVDKTIKVPRELSEKEKVKPKYQRGDFRSNQVVYLPGSKKGSNVILRSGSYRSTPYMTNKTIEVASDQYVEDWTDNFSKAKKFRIKGKALAKAEELAKNNCMEKIKPKVMLYEGDTNVRGSTKS